MTFVRRLLVAAAALLLTTASLHAQTAQLPLPGLYTLFGQETTVAQPKPPTDRPVSGQRIKIGLEAPCQQGTAPSSTNFLRSSFLTLFPMNISCHAPEATPEACHDRDETTEPLTAFLVADCMRLWNVLYRQGDYHNAATLADKALRLDPTNVQVRHAFTLARLMSALDQMLDADACDAEECDDCADHVAGAKGCPGKSCTAPGAGKAAPTVCGTCCQDAGYAKPGTAAKKTCAADCCALVKECCCAPAKTCACAKAKECCCAPAKTCTCATAKECCCAQPKTCCCADSKGCCCSQAKACACAPVTAACPCAAPKPSVKKAAAPKTCGCGKECACCEGVRTPRTVQHQEFQVMPQVLPVHRHGPGQILGGNIMVWPASQDVPCPGVVMPGPWHGPLVIHEVTPPPAALLPPADPRMVPPPPPAQFATPELMQKWLETFNRFCPKEEGQQVKNPHHCPLIQLSSFSGPAPTPAQISHQGGLVRLQTQHLEAQCQRLSSAPGQDRLVLEGNVELTSRRGSQPIRLQAQRVLVDLRDGSFTVETGR